jgi:dimethylhistidine N-methyltransferase
MAIRGDSIGSVTLTEPDSLPSAPSPALREDLRGEVMRGLLSSPKTLPPKLFYDEDGTRIFERISQLQEYYLTRAEVEILRQRADEIARLVGPDAALIEYGSGAGIKVRALLDALHPAAYIPVDIACVQLGRMAGRIAFDYPEVWVRPICADYTLPLRLPLLPEATRKVGFFPGSTIGNFHPSEAATFLRSIRRAVGPDGGLLLGVDRRKDAKVLEAAYNDAEGVTAKFNLHLLERLNREFGAHFNPSQFRHRAFFNSDSSRIEMHLVSSLNQTIMIGETPIHFERGETIRTEYSYKYDLGGLERLASAGGFVLHEHWTDAAEQFWVAYLEAKPERLADWRSIRRY